MRIQIYSDTEVVTHNGYQKEYLKSIVHRRIDLALKFEDNLKDIPKDKIELEEDYVSTEIESYFKITIYRKN